MNAVHNAGDIKLMREHFNPRIYCRNRSAEKIALVPDWSLPPHLNRFSCVNRACCVQNQKEKFIN